MTQPERVIWLVNLGVEPYEPVWELQRRIVQAKRAGWTPDILLLLEHEPVFTLGRQSQPEDMLVSDAFLTEQGVPVIPIERGGKVTYHGPGQLVGYPILDLHHYRTNIRWYHRSLAEVIMRTLADYGVVGDYDEAFPGVWVNGEKICAFGTMLRRWISFHGFALNLDPNMMHWRWIVPCGLQGKGVTSLRASLGWLPPPTAVRARVAQHFAAVFECSVVAISQEQLVIAVREFETNHQSAIEAVQ